MLLGVAVSGGATADGGGVGAAWDAAVALIHDMDSRVSQGVVTLAMFKAFVLEFELESGRLAALVPDLGALTELACRTTDHPGCPSLWTAAVLDTLAAGRPTNAADRTAETGLAASLASASGTTTAGGGDGNGAVMRKGKNRSGGLHQSVRLGSGRLAQSTDDHHHRDGRSVTALRSSGPAATRSLQPGRAASGTADQAVAMRSGVDALDEWELSALTLFLLADAASLRSYAVGGATELWSHSVKLYTTYCGKDGAGKHRPGSPAAAGDRKKDFVRDPRFALIQRTILAHWSLVEAFVVAVEAEMGPGSCGEPDDRHRDRDGSVNSPAVGNSIETMASGVPQTPPRAVGGEAGQQPPESALSPQGQRFVRLTGGRQSNQLGGGVGWATGDDGFLTPLTGTAAGSASQVRRLSSSGLLGSASQSGWDGEARTSGRASGRRPSAAGGRRTASVKAEFERVYAVLQTPAAGGGESGSSVHRGIDGKASGSKGGGLSDRFGSFFDGDEALTPAYLKSMLRTMGRRPSTSGQRRMRSVPDREPESLAATSARLAAAERANRNGLLNTNSSVAMSGRRTMLSRSPGPHRGSLSLSSLSLSP